MSDDNGRLKIGINIETDRDRARRAIRRAARNRDPWAGMVGGLAILAAGVIFWLDHLGRISAGDYLQWWPLILIAYGLAYLPARRWIAATILIVLGLAFLPQIEFLPHLHFGAILGMWPLLISAGGVTLIMQALRPAPKDARDGGAFRAISFMGGSVRTIDSEELTGGDAVAVMGGCEIRINSTRAAEGAVIDVLAFWGGVEIRVPRGWKVENHVAAILGGFADKTAPTIIADAPRLTIRGSVIMGGIEVRNPKDDTP
ncbi:MAG TPA: DUF5668 domain-containing protein [Thermoanaerobaculia bacterium]|nr:DUF5668 domain-containing protein [Thermoanaerobaculia bacterium]